MDTLKWLWKYVKRYRWSLAFSFCLTLIFVVVAFATPIIVGQIVESISLGTIADRLFFYIGLYMGFYILRAVVLYTRTLLNERVSQGVVKGIRTTLYDKLQTLDCSYYDRTRKGDIMSRLTMDTDAIRVLLASTIHDALMQVLFIIVGFVILYSTSPLLISMLFPVAGVVGVIAFFLAKNIKKDFIKMRECNAQLNTVVAENISGNRVVKAYAKEDYEIEKFEKKNKGYMDAYMGHIRTWVKYYPMLNLFARSIEGIFILVGGIQLLSGTITPGEFATFNGCLWCITNPMAAIGNLINQYQQFVASSLKIRQLEEETTLIQNRDVKKRDTGIEGKIQFKGVTFAYDGERVLKNANFTVEPGQTLAIVGPTGSGKTTIINLITRFYDPNFGTVYIDDLNVKNIDISTIRQNIASAMQDVFLFSDTIENNIAYGAPNATHEDVVRVAKIANAHDFIEKMEDGYDTMVGERGVGLSGGQRQRISLARALLKNPAILILDDTTSALDMETEYEIQENLSRSRRTKIIIAHRISSVKNADLILVLNHGNSIEWGTHERLVELGGYYKSVYEHQYGDFNRGPKYHINHPMPMSVSKGEVQ